MENVIIPLKTFNIQKRIQAIQDLDISAEDKKDLVKFLNSAQLGKVNKAKRLLPATLMKYLFTLRISLEFFKKPTSKLILKDVESFEKALSSDKLRSLTGKPFTANSKANIRTDLKVYLRWKLGNRSIPLTNWLDCRKPRKTPDYLSEEDVSKLFRACKSNAERFLISVLFDSGARAEEFHNIRFEDLQFPSGNDTFIKLTLKEEYSKTSGRVISLYWSNTLNAVRDYVEERKKEGIKQNDPIFSNSYDNSRQVLNRLGMKVLGRSIHYHLFRHSSATYYATKLNRQELCYRYGWTFSSDMPDVYISRSGMLNKQLDTKFVSTELEEYKKEMNSKIFALMKRVESLTEDLNSLEKS